MQWDSPGVAAPMNRFIEELKQRHVIRVAGVYTVVAWVLAQAAGVLEAGVGLPEWFDGFILATLALGFPVALILAWAFEMTPEGVQRTSDLDPDGRDSGPVRTRTTDHATLGALVVLTVLVAMDVWSDGTNRAAEPGARAEAEAFVRRSGGEGPPTIAVMPFVNMSEDPGNAYFADGISEEILNALARIDRAFRSGPDDPRGSRSPSVEPTPARWEPPAGGDPCIPGSPTPRQVTPFA